MDREFVYKSDKISTNSSTSVQYGINSMMNGSLNEKPNNLQAPYVATSSSSAIRGFETNEELNGTYRARTNNGYDNNDNSLNTQINMPVKKGYGNDKKNKKARVDFDEYWRTNI